MDGSSFGRDRIDLLTNGFQTGRRDPGHIPLPAPLPAILPEREWSLSARQVVAAVLLIVAASELIGTLF